MYGLTMRCESGSLFYLNNKSINRFQKTLEDQLKGLQKSLEGRTFNTTVKLDLCFCVEFLSLKNAGLQLCKHSSLVGFIHKINMATFSKKCSSLT